MGPVTGGERRNRRASERLPVQRPATCRVPASPHQVTVLDVSYEGCRLAFERSAALPGSTVNLDLARTRVVGQVAWTSGTDVGVRFHKRLPADVAIAVGLEEAPAELSADQLVGDALPVTGLRHWIRRVFGFVPARA